MNAIKGAICSRIHTGQEGYGCKGCWTTLSLPAASESSVRSHWLWTRPRWSHNKIQEKNTPAIYRISIMAYTDGSVVTKGRVQVTEVSTSSLTTGMEQNQNKTRDICSALRVAMACPMVNSPCCICGAVSHSHSMAYIYIRFPNSACSEKIIKHTIIQKSNFLYLPPFPQ